MKLFLKVSSCNVLNYTDFESDEVQWWRNIKMDFEYIMDLGYINPKSRMSFPSYSSPCICFGLPYSNMKNPIVSFSWKARFLHNLVILFPFHQYQQQELIPFPLLHLGAHQVLPSLCPTTPGTARPQLGLIQAHCKAQYRKPRRAWKKNKGICQHSQYPA